jgi:CDP-diacylglycerol--glycerol-3-phosphate 3-phosphatidyltransferase
MANIITCIRIICSIILLFCPVFSPTFYALYIAAGVSDMLDGAIARKTSTVSEFGSKLDTVADFVMVTLCLIKLLPVIHIPTWLLIWIIVIAVIKAVNLISGYVTRKKIVVLHTIMNKVTGILLFVLPLTLKIIDLKYSGAIASAVATFAAIQEGHMIRTEKQSVL